MPILSIFFGIIVRMWHDDHPPPHIHVERRIADLGHPPVHGMRTIMVGM